MSSRVATQLASNNYRLFQIYILQGDQNWQGGPVLAAKIGPAGPILAAKVVRGDQFWQNFLPKLVRPDRF